VSAAASVASSMLRLTTVFTIVVVCALAPNPIIVVLSGSQIRPHRRPALSRIMHTDEPESIRPVMACTTFKYTCFSCKVPPCVDQVLLTYTLCFYPHLAFLLPYPLPCRICGVYCRTSGMKCTYHHCVEAKASHVGCALLFDSSNSVPCFQ